MVQKSKHLGSCVLCEGRNVLRGASAQGRTTSNASWHGKTHLCKLRQGAISVLNRILDILISLPSILYVIPIVPQKRIILKYFLHLFKLADCHLALRMRMQCTCSSHTLGINWACWPSLR